MKKKILSVVMCAMMSISILIPDSLQVKAADGLPQPATIPAFPGAEGAGMYTSGGRYGDVYIVNNLNDSGPGSLRDAISQDNRMVVFAVSGTIYLQSPLGLNGRSNITIAGQTAPGDGICLANWNFDTSECYNCIIRYIRVRPGSANINKEPDAFGGRGANYLMVDHVSASWSTDETMSLYDNSNTTVQWSIASESLTLSGHVKGKHGYGGIWGGPTTTYHHNLLIHHSSRLPRFAGSLSETYANNVIYNWGFNNSYGGTSGEYINMMNNYYKPGPSTLNSVKGQIANPGDGNFYINGNVLYGNDAVTADNSKGLTDGSATNDLTLTAPYKSVDYTTVSIQDAQTAYNDVLNKVGAVLPKRDAVDARLIQDIKDGTGRLINREFEVGGYPVLKSAEAPTDTDSDGMPDAWETANGLNPNDASDGKVISPSGYSNLELYINSLVDTSYVADNPVVKLITPTYNELFAEGGQIKVDAAASDTDGIAKIEFYVGSVNDQTSYKAGEAITAPYSYTISDLKAGTYFISARAYDTKGNATQSTSIPVHVNGPEVTGTWTSVDIGETPVKGSGSLDGATGVMTVKGSGKITGTNDSFHFVYQPISGNASLTAKLNSIALIDNNAISGLMIRESLDPDAAEAMISTSIVKADRDENGSGDSDDTYYYTFFSSRTVKGATALTLDNKVYPSDTLPSLLDSKLPIWLKIERVDDKIIAYTSYDNSTWKELARKTISMGKDAYIGFAVDASQQDIDDVYYNTAKFSDIDLVDSFIVTDVSITDIFGSPVSSLTPGLSASVSATVNKNSLAIEEAVIAIQICDAKDNVIGTSYVKSKFTKGTTKTVKAGFSTPTGLEGLKIKAFVVNNLKDEMKISNEVVK